MSFLGLVCKAACAPPDPETQTVRVNDAARSAQQRTIACRLVEEKRNQQQRQELELQRQAAEDTEARLRTAEEEQERRRAEERQRAEEEEEEARRADEDRRAEEEVRRADSERLAEEVRGAQEQRAPAQERDKIIAFLVQHGFARVSAPRRSYLKTKYAIHTAAKRGDAELIEMLLEAGAEVISRDSKGKTAYQVAQALDKAGSHREALEVLARRPEAVGATSACVGGA